MDNAGKEASLCHAEQEARNVELHGGAHEEHSQCDDAPRDHDLAEPAAHAEAVEHRLEGNEHAA